MKFKPGHIDYKEKVKNSFNRQGFMKLLNAKLISVHPGFCEIRIPFDKSLTQQHGFFHAGIISTIADNAAGYASFSLMNVDATILTVEFKLNLLSPGDGDMLIGRANVLKKGRTLTICRSEVYIVKNGIELLCAASQSTLMELQNRPDHETPR